MKEFKARRAEDLAARLAWEAVFSKDGSGPPATSELSALEARREEASHRFMMTRFTFLPWLKALPAVEWDLATPEDVETRHGTRLKNRRTAFPSPDPVAVNESPKVPIGGRDHSWLSFAAPVLEDRVWARVNAPAEVKDPPTLVFLHGIAMETEMWRGSAGDELAAALPGLRVIRPEGPWHGRRRLPGWYGGEPILARGPLGLLEVFQAWIAELVLIIRWARETSHGPVFLGGVSLGALTSQLLATVCHDWPRPDQPDGLFLVGTSGDALALSASSLARATRLSQRLGPVGWSQDHLAAWLPLIAPQGQPAMAPEHIVMVLGSHDTVTDTAGGLALAQAWDLPAENLFLRRQGHFSVALGLSRDLAPFRRVADLMDWVGKA